MHDLPDFVYFNHSIHVNKGVGCTTCHGQVDRMPLMWQEQSLQMEWCLDCHRNPERYVRPRDAVFSVDYAAAGRTRSSSASGWSPSIRFRSSRAARRVTDEPTTGHEPRPRSSGARSRSCADDPAFQERLYNEFPSQVEAITDPVDAPDVPEADGRVARARRRHRLHAAARRRRSFPTSGSPRSSIPGKPLFFATAMTLGGVATGLLVESHEGRPTKIEGNPDHPGSLGATDVFAQAAILGLYDPDRSQTLTNLGEIRPWSAFLGAIRAALTAQQPLKGAGLRILTETVTSPTLAAQIRELLARFPSAKWHQWDPASRDNARAGAQLAFGEYVDAQYRFDQADVILALDADFLALRPGQPALRARVRRAAARRKTPSA